MGGAETLVVNLTSRLRRMGHEVDVCVLNGADTPLMQRLLSENRGIRVYRFGRGYYNPLYVLKLARIMRRYDIVHSHNSSPQLFVAMAGVLCSVVLCTTEHTTSNRKRGWKWYAPVESWMYGRYARSICISRVAEEKLREYIGGAWLDEHSPRYARISTVNNGVDVRAFHDAAPLPGVRTEGDFVTVMVAAFRVAKDQDTLIRAIAKLPAHYRLWLVGDGERRPQLEALAASLGVSDRVRLWGVRTDVPRILKTADVVAMSSHWEGLSLSNVEGMSAGRPFIASDVDGLREVTRGYGLLFPEGDADAVAALLRRLHDDRSFYRDTAERCYARAREYDISLTAKRYAKIYEEAMRDSKR